jgi:hypothetical protein
MSKGSRNRTADQKAYNENYERIFGKSICVLTSNSTKTDRHYEEAGSVNEEMRLMQEKMENTFPHYLIEQAD